MANSRAEIFAEIDQRRDWQDRERGAPGSNGRDRWLAILTEQLGKTAESCVKLGLAATRQYEIDLMFWRQTLRKKLIDVAAVAVAWIEDIDGRGGQDE